MKPTVEIGRWPPYRYIALAAAAVAGVVAALVFFSALREVFFLTFFAVLLAVILLYPINLLSRWMPRVIAATITLIGLLGAMVGVVLIAVPLAEEQGRDL